MERLAQFLEEAPASWLPISGHVVNVTFSLADRDLVVAALKAAARREAGSLTDIEVFPPVINGSGKIVL